MKTHISPAGINFELEEGAFSRILVLQSGEVVVFDRRGGEMTGAHGPIWQILTELISLRGSAMTERFKAGADWLRDQIRAAIVARRNRPYSMEDLLKEFVSTERENEAAD